MAVAWLILLGGYSAVCLWVPAGDARRSAANVLLCLMPLFVNGALLLNAVSPDWRKRAFWMLLALGSSLWMVGQIIWTYVEVYKHQQVADPFIGDIVFFLHTVPMIAALTMQPHKQSNGRQMLYSYVDFGLMFCWWLYLYVFAVIPWQYVSPNQTNYLQAFTVIFSLENFVFVGGAILLSLHSTGYWRRIYAHLAGAGSVFALRFLFHQLASDPNSYMRGRFPTSRCWFHFSGWAPRAFTLTNIVRTKRNCPQHPRSSRPSKQIPPVNLVGRLAWLAWRCCRFR